MTIKIAFIGLGWVTHHIWLPAFTMQNNVEIVAGADVSPDARASFGDRTGCKNAYSDPEDIFRHAPDLCIIAPPNVSHYAMAKLALTHGADVLIEKPVCLHLAEWQELSALATASTQKIFASSAARFRHDVALLRAHISAIGDIRCVELEWIRARGIPNTTSWFVDKNQSGGGAFVDLGWHLLDLCTHLFKPQTLLMTSRLHSADFLGDLHFEAAWKGRAIAAPLSTKPSVEDTAVCYLEADGKYPIKLHAAWASHRKHDQTRILIAGTKGEIELRTVFGFSTNGPEHPTIITRHRGEVRENKLAYEQQGIEYQRQAQDILGKMKNGAIATGEYDAIAKMAALLDSFYKTGDKYA